MDKKALQVLRKLTEPEKQLRDDHDKIGCFTNIPNGDFCMVCGEALNESEDL
jgi:rRNA maturation endonuclease Nob1